MKKILKKKRAARELSLVLQSMFYTNISDPSTLEALAIRDGLISRFEFAPDSSDRL